MPALKTDMSSAGTGFFWDERCFWHGGGNYASTAPVGGFVQPLPDGLPENPETKRRLKNLMDVSGLSHELQMLQAPSATREDLLRVHPQSYLDPFKALSDQGGGEIGLRAPFGPGGYDIAAVSAGLARQAIVSVAGGRLQNAYALSRPPGHHCLPGWANGFCLFNNIAIGIEAARAAGLTARTVVIDWDVHHGNGTEAIYLDRADVLTISLHQERNYPLDTGDFSVRGEGDGAGANLNLPLPPGAGHLTYLELFDRIVMPVCRAYRPDLIVVANGYDAAIADPLSRMLATAETFRALTRRSMDLADDLCEGRLVLVHEGGYSPVYVPFCGHAVLEELSGSRIHVPDPLGATYAGRQPSDRMNAVFSEMIAEMADGLALS